LCYRKAVWRERPFPDVDAGEDTRWVWGLRNVKIVALDDPSFYVVRVHANNTGTRPVARAPFAACAPETVERVMAGTDRIGCVAGRNCEAQPRLL
jgi:hypothetical protein